MVAEKFQIYRFKKNTERDIYESKKWICSFLHMPSSQTHHQAEVNYQFQPTKIFWRKRKIMEP